MQRLYRWLKWTQHLSIRFFERGNLLILLLLVIIAIASQSPPSPHQPAIRSESRLPLSQ